MKNISLADEQLLELIEYYNTEREKAWKRFEETNSLLEKLTGSVRAAVAETNGAISSTGNGAKRGRKPKPNGVLETQNGFTEDIQAPTGNRVRKNGRVSVKGNAKRQRTQKERKSKWGSFIVGTLKSKKQPLQVTQITDIAIEKRKFPVEEYDKAKAAIAGGLHRLTTVNKRLISFSVPGERGSFYSLAEWLDSNNRLKEKFNKLPAPEVEYAL